MGESRMPSDLTTNLYKKWLTSTLLLPIIHSTSPEIKILEAEAYISFSKSRTYM